MVRAFNLPQNQACTLLVMSTLETLEVMQSDVITMHQKAVVLCSFWISGISPAALMNSKFFPVAIASKSYKFASLLLLQCQEHSFNTKICTIS